MSKVNFVNYELIVIICFDLSSNFQLNKKYTLNKYLLSLTSACHFFCAFISEQNSSLLFSVYNFYFILCLLNVIFYLYWSNVSQTKDFSQQSPQRTITRKFSFFSSSTSLEKYDMPYRLRKGLNKQCIFLF